MKKRLREASHLQVLFTAIIQAFFLSTKTEISLRPLPAMSSNPAGTI